MARLRYAGGASSRPDTGLAGEQRSAGLVVGIAGVGGSEKDARVDDQHSVAPEAVGQHLVSVAGAPAG